MKSLIIFFLHFIRVHLALSPNGRTYSQQAANEGACSMACSSWSQRDQAHETCPAWPADQPFRCLLFTHSANTLRKSLATQQPSDGAQGCAENRQMERRELEGLGLGFGPFGRTQGPNQLKQPPPGGRDSAIGVHTEKQRGAVGHFLWVGLGGSVLGSRYRKHRAQPCFLLHPITCSISTEPLLGLSPPS